MVNNTVQPGLISSPSSNSFLNSYTPASTQAPASGGMSKVTGALMPIGSPQASAPAASQPAAAAPLATPATPSLASQLATAHQTALGIQASLAKMAANEQNQNTQTSTGTTTGLVNPASPTVQNGNPTTPPQTVSPTPAPFNAAVNGLTDIGSSNPYLSPEMQAAATNLAKQVSDDANIQKGIFSTPESFKVGDAQSAIAQTQGASEEAKLGSVLAGLEQGTGQQVTALSNAGTLTQPSATAPGQAVFSPATGTYTSANSTNGNAASAPSGYDQGVWNQYIQDYATGNFGAIPSSVTGNQAIYGQLQQAVQVANPNFNYNQATGAASAAQSNAQTQGTFNTNTAATGGAAAVQGYNTLNAANTQFENQASTLLDTINQYKLNGAIPDVNKALNTIAGKLGSTGVSALNSAFAETVAAYNNILSSNGGTPTAQDQQAEAALSINSTPAQIATALQQLQSAAATKLGAAQSLAQGYQNNLSGGTSGASNGSAGAFSDSSFYGS